MLHLGNATFCDTNRTGNPKHARLFQQMGVFLPVPYWLMTEQRYNRVLTPCDNHTHKLTTNTPTNSLQPQPQTHNNHNHKLTTTTPTNSLQPHPQTHINHTNKLTTTIPTNSHQPHQQTHHNPTHKLKTTTPISLQQTHPQTHNNCPNKLRTNKLHKHIQNITLHSPCVK